MLHRLCQLIWFCGVLAFAADDSLAAETLIEVLPPGAAVSAELIDSQALLQHLRTSDVVKALLASEPYAKWAKSNDGAKFLGGKAILEAQLGMSLWDAAECLFGDRVAAAVYLPKEKSVPPDGVVVLRFAKESTAKLLREKLSPWIELAGGAVTATERDGVWLLATKDGKAYAALHGSWLVLSNQTSIRDNVLSRIRNGGPNSLASTPAWQQAAAAGSPRAGTRLSVVWDAAPLKERQAVARLLPSEVDNPVGSLLLGGLMEVAALASSAHATVSVDASGFRISLASPLGVEKVDAAHQTLLATAKQARDLAPAIPRQLAGFTLCRRWADWYRQREDLIEDKTLPEFDKFETGLSTFLPGKDFREDVLSLLNPPLSFVAAEQTYPHLDGKPGMQLPAFAVVLDLTDPARGSDVFQLFFQTLGTIVNIEAGKQGRAPWVMNSESHKDVQITFAKYLDRPQGKELPPAYNFQPASAVVGSKYIAATSLELCRDLIDALQQGRASATPLPNLRNLEFSLDPVVGARLLDSNRPVITAKGVQSGKSLEQANGELDFLVGVLRRMNPITLLTNVSAERVEVRLEGSWK